MNVQLNVITSERLKDLDKGNKKITCKYARSCTAVEQDYDTIHIFRSTKPISKNLTTDNAPSMGLKLIVHNICKDLTRDNKLMVSPTKEGVLNNFFFSSPTIIAKATTTSYIKSGFVYNGMVDNITYTNPDLMAILNTCKTKKFMQSAKQAVESNFKKLYEEKMRVGMLTDEHLNTYKVFQRDIRYDGTEALNHSKTEILVLIISV